MVGIGQFRAIIHGGMTMIFNRDELDVAILDTMGHPAMKRAVAKCRE